LPRCHRTSARCHRRLSPWRAPSRLQGRPSDHSGDFYSLPRPAWRMSP